MEEIVAIADGSRFSPKEQNFNDMYPITKFVATLWMGAMARKGAPNNIRFVTMSPGMTSGTNVADKAPAIQQFIFNGSCILSSVCLGTHMDQRLEPSDIWMHC